MPVDNVREGNMRVAIIDDEKNMIAQLSEFLKRLKEEKTLILDADIYYIEVVSYYLNFHTKKGCLNSVEL